MTTSSITDRIVRYIMKRQTTTLDTLEGVVVSKGFTLDDLYIALEQVHKDKRIQVRNLANGVTYSPAVAKVKPAVGSHLTWVNGLNDQGKPNYPPMDNTNDGSGLEADYSYLVLSPDEIKAYKAAAKNMPVHMIKSTHGKNPRM